MILALTESNIPVSVRTLGVLLTARLKRERLETYQSELVYLLAKRYYRGINSPSKIAEEIYKPPTKAKPKRQIISDLIRKLG